MPAVARLGDEEMGVCDIKAKCCPHSRGGTNSTASLDVFVNGIGVHRKGDMGVCNCPHTGNFVTTGGSGTVFINGRAAVRIADSTLCQNCGQSGVHTTGSDNVFIGG